ncbi:DUF551 domain-containing protein [Citrobacter freundii]|uniref:DUF551 domain-containing protein n=1 Tax=Citrobacter freundii TaxID=546 RepID=UPI000A51E95C|nr:DUF551 domain-containing protein [Citrobacter freundii]
MTTNHPAHGPVSLDRLHQISEILSKAAAQSDGGNLGYAMADAVKVIDGAIAAFGAEPAPVDIEMLATVLRNAPLAPSDSQGKPRAPVVPDEDPRDAFERTFKMPKHVTRCGTGYAVTAYSAWLAHDFVRMWEGWNACRAAMLQGAEPASNCDELPLDYLQGHKDGLEWAAQLAEANHPQTGDWLYDDPIELARAIRKGPDMPTVQDGKSPVAPGAWIPVSERMPNKLIPVMVMYEDGEMWSAMWNGNRWDDGTEYPDPHSVTHWRKMPAAPQQEVKLALEHGMRRYAGAMQKLSEGDD